MQHARCIRGQTEGITPVIGSILVLMIMVFSIGGIMVWGAPAIAGLQEQAQFESVTSQVMQTNADVRSLWDPQNSKIAALSFKSGKLFFGQGDRWIVSAARDSAYDGLRISGWESGDPFTVNVLGLTFPLAATNKITVNVVEGSVFTEVYSCNGAGTGGLPACVSALSTGDNTANCPWAGGVRRACLTYDVVRIRVTDDTTVKAEAWFFNAGRLSYRYSDADDRNQIHMEMGAVITQHEDYFFLQQAPPIKDPDYSTSIDDNNLYVRFLHMKGPDFTKSGTGRFHITFALQDNYGPQRGRPLYDQDAATMVRLQVHGSLEEAFCNIFEERSGWEQRDLTTDFDIVGSGDCTGVDATRNVNVFYDRNDASLGAPLPKTLQFHLNQAQVNVHG